jgi:hypothetical protein
VIAGGSLNGEGFAKVVNLVGGSKQGIKELRIA